MLLEELRVFDVDSRRPDLATAFGNVSKQLSPIRAKRMHPLFREITAIYV